MDRFNLNDLKFDFNNILPDMSALKLEIEPPVFDYEITPLNETIENSIGPILNKNQGIIDALKENCEELQRSNALLVDLNNKKDKEIEEAKRDAKKAKRYNNVMLVIAIISMLIAVSAWLIPDVL